METYVLAGGQIDSLNRWQQDLNSQFLPIYKNGKPVKFEENGGLTHRRLLVAPVQLFKICYPKECEEMVMSMVCPTDYINKRYPVINKMVGALRRVLGLKKHKVPKSIYPFTQPNQVDKAVFVVPIGTKEDQFIDGSEVI